MADGTRFPASSFRPQNHHISSPFSGENSSLPSKFPALPPNTFFPQSDPTSSNSVRGHVPQMFPGNPPGQDIVYRNIQRFPPPFHQNQSNLQQDKHSMAVHMPKVQRHPFPASQFITNSSANFHSFSTHGQLQFPTSNTQMNMNSNIAQSSSPFPTGAPQRLQNTPLQAASYVPVPHEQSALRTFPESFPAPFLGPVSGPPVAAPMQFPPPLPSTTPMVHLTAPPVIRHLDASGQNVQETTSQEWINNFLKERGIAKQIKQTPDPNKSHMKVCTFITIINVIT